MQIDELSSLPASRTTQSACLIGVWVAVAELGLLSLSIAFDLIRGANLLSFKRFSTFGDASLLVRFALWLLDNPLCFRVGIGLSLLLATAVLVRGVLGNLNRLGLVYASLTGLLVALAEPLCEYIQQVDWTNRVISFPASTTPLTYGIAWWSLLKSFTIGILTCFAPFAIALVSHIALPTYSRFTRRR